MPGPTASFDEIRALAASLPEWQGVASARIDHPRLVLFAAAHGIAADIPGGAPDEMAAAVEALVDGRGPLHALVAAADCDLRLYELALHLPTRDSRLAPAMDEAAAAHASAYGMMAVEPGVDLFVVSALGIGAELAGAKVSEAVFGDEAGDPLDLVAALGGPDIAAILGAILAARLAGVRIVLDGAAAFAAAAVAAGVRPDSVNHCLCATQEAGRLSADRLGLSAILSDAADAPLSGVRALSVLRARDSG
jgi:nicotinate-nucleotide--dimethylbenzimidazole phosphoribosyltransferase